MTKGIFMALEGGEGSAKSTQIQILKNHFEELGREVVLTKDPGGDRISSLIRAILLHPDNTDISHSAELLLYLAARAQINENVIQPAIERNAVVISDRHIFSTVAYQCRVRKSYTEDLLWSILGSVPGLAIIPDLTVIIDIDPEIGLRRSIRRLDDNNVKEGRFENLPMDFHRGVRKAYINISKDYADKTVLVDGSGTVLEVTVKIVEAIKSKRPELFV